MSDYVLSIHRRPKGSLLAAADRLPRKKTPVPTADRPLYVSPSELGDFRRCRVRHYWRYHLSLEPNAEFEETRRIGLLFHEGQQIWYGMPWKKRSVTRMNKIIKRLIRKTSMQELDTKDKNLLIAMAGGYAEWALSDADYSDRQVGLRTSFPEEKFDLPLTADGRIRMRGKIDNRFISAAKKKTMAMQETKTRKNIDFNVFDISDQVTSYLWSLSVKYPGFKQYTAYPTIVRRQMPGPRVKTALFGRTEVTRTPEEIAIWLEDTRRVAEDMLDAAVYPNKTKECAWDCDFKLPCSMRGDPAELKDVLRGAFHVKDWSTKEKK
jgi:hypothetical protein